MNPMAKLVLAGALAITVLSGVAGAPRAQAAEITVAQAVSFDDGKCIRKGVRLSDDGRSLIFDPSCTGPDRRR